MWYSAHAIFYFKCENQDSFLVHENIYLVLASDGQSALALAIAIARENEDFNENGTLLLNDKPAQYVFAGIRKVVEVEMSPDAQRDKIVSGLEVTYSELEVDTLEDVNRLVSGEFVEILYRE